MMEKKKVIIFIFSEGAAADTLQAIKETWASTKLEGIEVLFLYWHRDGLGLAPGQCIQHNDELFCGVSPANPYTRLMIAINHIYENYDFEYLLTGCTGQYINQNRLIEFLKDKPTSKFYYFGVCCMFMSKDLVKMINDTIAGDYLDHYKFGPRGTPNDDFLVFFKDKGILCKQAPAQTFIDHNGILIAQSLENGTVVKTQSATADDLLFEKVVQFLDRNQFRYHCGYGDKRPSFMYEVHRTLALDNIIH
jgi:hypothetical protein